MGYIKWRCTKCGDIIISNTNRRHQADFCKCGQAMCDSENDYVRWGGNVEYLNKFDYNFFNELVYCMDKQGFIAIGIKWNDGHFWITLQESMFIRKLEDEICKKLKGGDI